MPRGKAKPKKTTTAAIDTSVETLIEMGSTSVVETVGLQTKEQAERSSVPVMEKSRDAEKDTAPVIIVSWSDTSGKRHTKTYSCAEVRINEDKSETLQKSGKKTSVNISIEAQVLEMD